MRTTLKGPLLSLSSLSVLGFVPTSLRGNSWFPHHLPHTWISRGITSTLPYQLALVTPFLLLISSLFQTINSVGVTLFHYAALHIFKFLICHIILWMTQFPNAWLRWAIPLRVLDLKRNKLSGTISDTFLDVCVWNSKS